MRREEAVELAGKCLMIVDALTESDGVPKCEDSLLIFGGRFGWLKSSGSKA